MIGLMSVCATHTSDLDRFVRRFEGCRQYADGRSFGQNSTPVEQISKSYTFKKLHYPDKAYWW